MNSEWIKARQTKYGVYVTTYIIVIIAVLAAVNWLANRHNKSIDTTANKRFSLSDQTKKVVSGLKHDVTITYFDKQSAFTAGKDVLDRYHNLSPKLHVNYVDPEKKPDVAKAAGIRNYGAITIQNGARREEAKSLSEEDVTGALIRALKTGDRNACFVTGSGEPTIEDTGRSGYSGIKDALEKNNYKTRSVSLLEKPEVPKDCTVLIVAGPKRDYIDPAVNAVKTYVEGGGHALFMIDPPLALGRGEENGGSPAISKVLEGWGVTPEKDLVLDTSGVGQFFGFNEAAPVVTKYESQPIVKDMAGTATVFPLTRSLDVKSDVKSGGTVEKLFSTSANSYATTNLNLSKGGAISIDPKTDKKGPFVIGAAGSLTGAGKPRFVVVGSSGWVSNSILGAPIGNRDLFLNMINWLSADEDLISIRPKDPEDRRINLTQRQMAMLFYSSVVFLPLIVIAFGFTVYWRRR